MQQVGPTPGVGACCLGLAPLHPSSSSSSSSSPMAVPPNEPQAAAVPADLLQKHFAFLSLRSGDAVIFPWV